METRRTNKGGAPPRRPGEASPCPLPDDRETPLPLAVGAVGRHEQVPFHRRPVVRRAFRVVKVEKTAVEYCAKLTEFYAQFRAVAVNYNQVVKALHSNFSEKKALAFLYKLEKATTELAALNRQVIALTNECKELWLPK